MKKMLCIVLAWLLVITVSAQCSIHYDAEFPGGTSAWIKYLNKNRNDCILSNRKASPGIYTVTVNFIIGRDGTISNVVAENDPGYGAAQEAVRVIKESPKWQPATQNGRNIVYRMRETLVFKVSPFN